MFRINFWCFLSYSRPPEYLRRAPGEPSARCYSNRTICIDSNFESLSMTWTLLHALSDAKYFAEWCSEFVCLLQQLSWIFWNFIIWHVLVTFSQFTMHYYPNSNKFSRKIIIMYLTFFQKIDHNMSIRQLIYNISNGRATANDASGIILTENVVLDTGYVILEGIKKFIG